MTSVLRALEAQNPKHIKRRIKVTEAQVDEMLELVRAGMSYRQVAERYGVDKSTAGKRLALRGHSTRHGRVLDELLINAIIADYRAGEMSLPAIALKHGVHKETVYRYTARAGVARYPGSYPHVVPTADDALAGGDWVRHGLVMRWEAAA